MNARRWFVSIASVIVLSSPCTNPASAYRLNVRTTSIVSAGASNTAAYLAFRNVNGSFQILQSTKDSEADSPSDWFVKKCYFNSSDQQICPVSPSTVTKDVNVKSVSLAVLGDTLYAAWLVPGNVRQPGRVLIAMSSVGGVAFGPEILIQGRPPQNLAPTIAVVADVLILAWPRDAGRIDYAVITPDRLKAAARSSPYTLNVFVHHLAIRPSNLGNVVGTVAVTKDERAIGRPAVIFATLMAPSRAFLCNFNIALRSQYLDDMSTRDGENEIPTGPVNTNISITPFSCQGPLDPKGPSSPAIAIDPQRRLVVAWAQNGEVIARVSDPDSSTFGPPRGIGQINIGTIFQDIGQPTLFDLFGITTSAWQGVDVTFSRFGSNDDGHINIQSHVPEIATNERPVVFLPGAAGSLLYEGDKQLWPGCPFDTDHTRLKMAPGLNGEYVSEHPVFAKDMFRKVNCTKEIALLGLLPFVGNFVFAGLISGAIDATASPYQPMVDYLKGARLLREYDHQGNPSRLTMAGCDVSQRDRTHPNFFVFPYDWRQDIAKNAQELRDYVGCIRRMYPDTQVDILAHSMGGLVARRYILEGEHHVAHLATLGTPWLGAPKFPYVAFTGDFDVSEILISHQTIREIVTFSPGLHQLMPSRAYFELIGTRSAPRYWLKLWPLVEAGFDLNTNGKRSDPYDVFDTFAAAVDGAFPPLSHPASNTAQFHDVPGQDDWRQDESTVSYLHVVGVQQSNQTPVQVNARGVIFCGSKNPANARSCAPHLVFDYVRGIGDGTVPLLSASRLGGNYGSSVNGKVILEPAAAGEDNLNVPRAIVLPMLGSVEGDKAVQHGELPNNKNILDIVLDFFATDTVPSVLTAARGQVRTPAAIPSPPSSFTLKPSFDVVTDGFDAVIVTDENGISFNASVEMPPRTMISLTPFFVGPQAVQIFAPANHTYEVRLTATDRPSAVTIKQGLTSGEDTSVVRYLDLAVPKGTALSLTLGPTDAGTLQADMDGDGTFETPVTPTAAVDGPAAQDVEPPTLQFSAMNDPKVGPRAVLLDIAAADSGAGVKEISYSLDGTTFFPYTSTLRLDPIQTPVVYAFAEDNVANRSGVFTYRPARGDLDRDGDVDQDDLTILLADRGKSVEDSVCGAACDLDRDGRITALDARKLQLLCTRSQCGTQ